MSDIFEREARKRAARYVRVSGNFDDFTLSDSAFRALLRLACWSAEWGLAGWVPKGCLRGLVPAGRRTKRIVAELEAAGFLQHDDNCYRIVHRGLAFRRDDAEHWDRSEVGEVIARDGHRCRYCGATDDLTIDHLIPRCRGGNDKPSNLVVACRSCNSSKGARTPNEAGMTLLPLEVGG